MKINPSTHLLEGAKFKKTPNTHSGTITPKVITFHYTAGGSASGSISWLCMSADERKKMWEKSNPGKEAPVFGGSSANFVIDRDGTITQLAPTNVGTWHIGVVDSSVYDGPHPNKEGIGIEIANYGYLKENPDGTFSPPDYPKIKLSSDKVVDARHKNSTVETTLSWEKYPDAQMDSLFDLVDALLEAYPSITRLIGHEDAAPSRKLDPGPAFVLHHICPCDVPVTRKVRDLIPSNS